MNIEIAQVDYRNTQQADELFELLNEYASEPMGGGRPLPQGVRDGLASGLAQANAFSLIAYVDGQPAAMTNCLFGFSTFVAKKLVNIHDLMVSKNFRGKGLSYRLLERVEEIARENDCVKITLEVLSNNEIAKKSYLKFGFEGYQLDPESGQALFWQKKLE